MQIPALTVVDKDREGCSAVVPLTYNLSINTLFLP